MNKSPPNYSLKAKVLSNGCCKVLKKYSLYTWKWSQEMSNSINTGDYTKYDKYLNLSNIYEDKLKDFSNEDIKESYKVVNAEYKRNQRLKNRIEKMLLIGNAIFLTLTFKPDVLETTSIETRHKYIIRFLKENCSQYIANIDFGKKNEREHYHAVVIAYNDKIDNNKYPYGNIDFERVRLGCEFTSKKLAKYVNKLCNHAIKDTCKQNRVIYSRNKN